MARFVSVEDQIYLIDGTMEEISLWLMMEKLLDAFSPQKEVVPVSEAGG